MSFINYSSKEVNCKIVFYGPGLSGKTANLKYIYNTSNPATRGKLIALTGDDNRSLFFDFLPIDLGKIGDFRTRFHLYTVPGQVLYEFSRRLLIKGVDGLVFVADSQEERMEANKKALEKLESHLEEYGYDIKKIPMVFQYNKRDLPNVLPVSKISEALNGYSKPEFETVAVKGTGVYDTLKGISKLVLDELKGGL